MPEIKKEKLSVSEEAYDVQEGKVVCLVTLKNDDLSISITNLGCSITAIETPDRNGIVKNIVAGYANLTDYAINEHYLGCALGRYANRISGGKYELDGRSFQLSKNDGDNHLHGGFHGFSNQLWERSEIFEQANQVGVSFTYLSKNGEEGYPGNLNTKITFILNELNQLSIHYEADTDQPTPINLSNHSYFNLTGFDSPNILKHTLQINADGYTETEDSLPTGRTLPVAGTSFDFSRPRLIGQDAASFSLGNGYNQNYVLRASSAHSLVAKLWEEETGRYVAVYTDQPGLQLYTANLWNGEICSAQGKPYKRYGAVAIETQNFPDSPNQPRFPGSILYPGEHYTTVTTYEFGNSPSI